MDSKVLCTCTACSKSGGGKLLSRKVHAAHFRKSLKVTEDLVRQQNEQRQSAEDSLQDQVQACPNMPDKPTWTNFGPSPATNNHDNHGLPLYQGSPVSLLQAVTLLLSIHGLFPGVSQRAISELLRMLHRFILPNGNILPESYRAAKKLVDEYLIPVETHDVCPNDHIIFSGVHSSSKHCPECKESRYKAGTDTPVKTFPYIPLIPRLQRWFKMPAIADSLQQHMDIAEQNPVTDIHMSPAWKGLYDKDGDFKGNGRCLTFALSADGFDPFNHQKVQYSMCPVLLKCLNFDHSSRDKIGRLLLSAIIPGPCGPDDMNPYLSPLVDELNQLAAGVDCFDASTSSNFKLKARVLLGVFDNPGGAKVLKSAGPGSLNNACKHCQIKGVYSREYKKVIYQQNRRFLPPDSMHRGNTTGFGTEERRPPFIAASKDTLIETGLQVASLKKRALTEATNALRKKAKTEAAKIQKATGRKGIEELARLPYYRDVDFPVELMHTIQVVMKKFFGLFTGKDNTPQLRAAETALGRLAIPESRKLPLWVLTPEEKSTADRRLMEIKVTHGFDWRPKKLFTKTSLPYLKCSDWKKLASAGILKYALQNALGLNQRQTFFRLCDAVSQLTDHCIDIQELDAVEAEVHEVLSLVERDFPLGIQTLCMHILHHACTTLRKYGPATSQWMYGFERFMAFLSGRILNRKQPEATAIEAYRMYEFSQFMAMAGLLPKGSVCTSNSYTVQAANEETTEQVAQESFNLLEGKRPSLQVDMGEEEQVSLQSQGMTCTSAIKYFQAMREHPRCQKYTCRDIDLDKPIVSSVVAGLFTTGGTLSNKLEQGYLFFGRISYFLQCKGIDGKMEDYARVEWYEAPIPAEVKGLWKVVQPAVVIQTTLVPLQKLSPPLITAVESTGTVWVLDFNVKYINKIH